MSWIDRKKRTQRFRGGNNFYLCLMFYLPFDIAVSEKKIGYSNHIVLLGSCFADAVGDRMLANKFQVVSNPFGTIYNPISQFKILRGEINENRIIENQGIYYHWDAHSKVSSLKEEDLLTLINEKQKEIQSELQRANWLIITFGSAFAYHPKSTGDLVANCHKRAAGEFQKVLLTTEAITTKFEKMIKHLAELNPNLNIILTVSPVRHTRDGLVENNRSKARLIEACHSIIESYDRCSYFPAYEILLDELREYRFYAKDKVHPSSEAIDYIWKRFTETYFDKKTHEFLKKWSSIKSALAHRPFHSESDQHQTFLKNTIQELRVLEDDVDISTELSLLEGQLV